MKKTVMVCIIALCTIVFVYYFYASQFLQQDMQNQDVQNNLASIEVQDANQSKMRKFIHNKLWRDSGPARMEAVGSIVHVTILQGEELIQQLKEKAKEEVLEICQATTDEDLISEIGDLYEVIDCIITLRNLSRDKIATEQKLKREERGSLLEGKFVTMTESIPGSYLDLYCSKDPNKYTLMQ